MIELQHCSLFICLGTPFLLSLTCECQSVQEGYGAAMYASNTDAYATTTLPHIQRPDVESSNGYGDDGYGETMRFVTVGTTTKQPGPMNATAIAKQLGGSVAAPKLVIRHPFIFPSLLRPSSSTTSMAGSSDSLASSSSSLTLIIPIAVGLTCLCSVAALGVFFVLRYRTRQRTAIECEHVMQERQAANDPQFKTAFEWDALAIEGVKVGNWREFRTAAERILPGVRQDFVYSRSEFLEARKSVQLVNADDFRTRVWME